MTADRDAGPGMLQPVMEGFPPPAGERWTLAGWQQAPQNRWSFQHVREVVRTARVWRGEGPARELPVGEPLDLDDEARGVLAATQTDGVLVLHRGRVVVETYPEGMHPATTHLLMSVSKSFVGCVAGILADRGELDIEAPLTEHVPELAGSGYAGATARHLLDMRSGVRFSETYLDLDAEVRKLEEVMGWRPRAHDDLPDSMYEYLATLERERPHGGAFSYRSAETDVLGWVCERAAGTRMPELLSQVLWAPLRPEQDMDAAVDAGGAVFHDGGLCATLRDLARFGQMLLDGGRVDDRQVVPESWVADSLAGGPDSREAFAAADVQMLFDGSAYRNQFWLPYADRPALLGLGIHGQLVYVEPARHVVVAKLSSWPLPQHSRSFLTTLALVDRLAAALGTRAE